MTEHKPYEGIYLDGETEYIRVENGISGFIIMNKALSAEEISKRYKEKAAEHKIDNQSLEPTTQILHNKD